MSGGIFNFKEERAQKEEVMMPSMRIYKVNFLENRENGLNVKLSKPGLITGHC